MNKKSFLYLLLFLTVAILLRIWHIDKPEGMWNDEYLTWKIASAKLPFDFFNALKSNCHAPLHYLYLKGWMLLFNDTDKFLRLSSVLPGVLGILVLYFASKELQKKDNENFALATVLFCSINSFLIYFSQEVRIYSLLFFLTSFVLLYALKIFENPSKKNFFLYSLFSLLLILTHTIGFVFIFYSTAALMVFAVSKKKAKEFILFSILGVIILALPFIPFIASILFKTGYFSQWWAPFNFSRTLFFLTDIFSPVLTDTSHVYNTFFDAFYKNGVVNLGFLIFALVPTIIGIISFIKGIIGADKKRWYLISVFVCTFLTVLIASMAGKIVFVTKYLTEIVPVIILLGTYGFCSFKSKTFKIAAATIFIVINLFFIIVSNTSAVKILKEEGQRLPVVALENMHIKKNDKILFLYYPKEWFYKYVNFNNPENEPYLTAIGASKYNFPRYLKYGITTSVLYKDGNMLLQEALSNDTNAVLNRTIDDIFKSIEPGNRLFLVDLTSVSFFPMSIVNEIARNPYRLQHTPILFLAMSYIKEFTLKKAKNELVYGGYYNIGAWRIYVFKKA